MEDEKRRLQGTQSVCMEDRKRVLFTGVVDVGSYSEETIRLSVPGNRILIRGSELHMQKLELESGEVVVTGTVQSISYLSKKDAERGALWKRLLK